MPWTPAAPAPAASTCACASAWGASIWPSAVPACGCCADRACWPRSPHGFLDVRPAGSLGGMRRLVAVLALLLVAVPAAQASRGPSATEHAQLLAGAQLYAHLIQQDGP